MIYILAGENTFASRRKAREIYERFVAVAGSADATVRVSVPALSAAEVRAVLETGSLFRNKRLVILEDAHESAADVAEFLTHAAPTLAASGDIFLFLDGNSDAKSPLATALREHAVKAQEFKKPSAVTLASWVDAEAKTAAGTLSAREKRHIVERAHGNMWRLAHEFEKMVLTPAHMRDDGSVSASSASIFSFTDAFGARRRRDAVAILHQLLREGADSKHVFSTLLWHMRTLASIRDLAERGGDRLSIAKQTKLHPFVVQKGLAQARAFTASNIARIYRLLSELDIDVKQNRADLALGLERIALSV